MIRIRQLFERGEASPYDTDEWGNTLLLVHSLPPVGDYLIDHGVPVGEKAVDGLYYHRVWSIEIKFSGTVPPLESMTVTERDAEGSSNTLGFAVIERSSSKVRQILQYCPQSIFEKNEDGENVLHLACGWPSGPMLILEYGGKSLVNSPSHRGLLPLHYAIYCQDIEAIRVLLQQGSSLALFTTDSNLYAEDCLSLALRVTSDEQVMVTLIEALADRRRDSFRLAHNSLPPQSLIQLRLNKDRLLDEQADSVYKALLSFRVDIPPRLQFEQTCSAPSLYRNKDMTTEIAEHLYRTELTETSTTLVSFLQNTWSKRMMKYFEEPSDNIVAQTYIGDVEVCLSQDEEYYKAGQERIRLWSEGFEEVDGMDSNCNSTNFICHTP
ncbi:MAG: hypothetical protein Q9157_004574 [Trypethelium eluteriae]